MYEYRGYVATLRTCTEDCYSKNMYRGYAATPPPLNMYRGYVATQRKCKEDMWALKKRPLQSFFWAIRALPCTLLPHKVRMDQSCDCSWATPHKIAFFVFFELILTRQVFLNTTELLVTILSFCDAVNEFIFGSQFLHFSPNILDELLNRKKILYLYTWAPMSSNRQNSEDVSLPSCGN